MKRTLVIIFLCAALLPGTRSIAQQSTIDQPGTVAPKKDSAQPKLEFGLKLGLNMQSISGDIWNNNYKPGVAAGITIGGHRKKFGLRAEVLISISSYQSGSFTDTAGKTRYYITDSAGDKGQFRGTSITIPVMFEYSIIPALKVQVGPQYSNLISLKSTNGMGGDPKVLFKQSEFSAVFGLEAKLPAHFSVGARYIMGLSDINNQAIDQGNAWKNNTIQVYGVYQIQ